MNNSDLERLLKSAEVPARADEYWEQFPEKVMAKIHWQPKRTATFDSAELCKPRRAGLVGGLGLVSACIIIGLAISFRKGHTPSITALQLAQAKKYFREIEALFPNQLQAIVFDEQGARLILAEKAIVPNSPPIYVKVCQPGGCQSFVTFSGQQIRINGDEFDVLLDAEENVILVGKHLIWSSGSLARVGKYQVEARSLGKSS